jgi:hypothetical protein
VDEVMQTARLISTHLDEIRDLAANNNPENSNDNETVASSNAVGEVEAQIAFNESRQIVKIRLVRAWNLKARLDQRELNFSLGVRDGFHQKVIRTLPGFCYLCQQLDY